MDRPQRRVNERGAAAAPSVAAAVPGSEKAAGGTRLGELRSAGYSPCLAGPHTLWMRGGELVVERDARTFALAQEAIQRHRGTEQGTCAYCLPPDTRWPCLPYRLAEETIAKLGADFPSAPIHPDWLSGEHTDG